MHATERGSKRAQKHNETLSELRGLGMNATYDGCGKRTNQNESHRHWGMNPELTTQQDAPTNHV